VFTRSAARSKGLRGCQEKT